MSRFLTSPSMFPARLAGEPWGAHRVTLDLPGGPFVITGISEAQALSLGDRYQRRDAPPSIPFEIAVFRAAPSDFKTIDTRGWEYELEIDGEAIAGMDLMARLGPERAAIWTTVTARDAFWGVVENVLRPLLARRLLAGRALLVHSASVVVDGRGFLFAGMSGDGKSTIAAMALAAGHEVLSDDLNAVGDGEILPLPFTGDLPSAAVRNTAAPLHAIVALEKGSHDAMRPLSTTKSTSLLVRCAPYVNRDPAFGDALLDRAHELAVSARTGVLTFRKDGNPWPILTAW